MDGNDFIIQVDKVAELAQLVFDKGGIDIEATHGIRVEIAIFMIYIAMADDAFDWNEMAEIAKGCRLEINESNISEFLDVGGISSGEYAKSIPITFQIMVEADKLLHENGSDLNCSGNVLDMFKFFAHVSVNKLGYINDKRQQRASQLLNKMEKFMCDNAPWNSTSIEAVSEPATVLPFKKGVAAPKKK